MKTTKLFLLFLAVLFCGGASAQARTRLSTDVTFSVPGEFPTMQAAWNHIQRNLDLNCFRATVQVADGSYGAFVANGPVVGGCGTEAVTLRGNVANPGAVAISGVGQNAVSVHGGASLKIEGFLIVAVDAPSFMTGGHGMIVYEGSRVILGNMVWYVCEWAHLVVSGGALVNAETSQQHIWTGSKIFALVEAGGKLWMNGATITNWSPVTYTNAFVLVSQQGLADFSGTIMNAVGGPISGRKCDVSSNALLILLGMAWPGPAGGCTVSSGGQVL